MTRTFIQSRQGFQIAKTSVLSIRKFLNKGDVQILCQRIELTKFTLISYGMINVLMALFSYVAIRIKLGRFRFSFKFGMRLGIGHFENQILSNVGW